MMKNKGYLQQNQHGQMLNDDEFHLSVAKRTGFGCNGDHIPVSEHEPTAVGKRQQEREGKEVHPQGALSGKAHTVHDMPFSSMTTHLARELLPIEAKIWSPLLLLYWRYFIILRIFNYGTVGPDAHDRRERDSTRLYSPPL